MNKLETILILCQNRRKASSKTVAGIMPTQNRKNRFIVENGEQRWLEIKEKHPGLLTDRSLPTEALCILGCSEFLHDTLMRHPEWLDDIQNATLLSQRTEDYANSLNELLEDCADESALMSRIRQFRNRMMATIAWQDLGNK